MRARLGTRSSHSSAIARTETERGLRCINRSPAGISSARSRCAAFLLLLCCVSAVSFAQSTFKITSATYTPVGETAYEGSNAIIPAGVNGAQLTLTGTLPTAATQSQAPVQGCFYTGYGSTTAFSIPLPNGANTAPFSIPASSIQSIPSSAFTASNNFGILAKVYYVASGGTCDGTFDSTLTNQYPIRVAAPSLAAYAGPTSIPQTNPATGIQSAPTTLSLPATGLLYYSAEGGTTTITFGSFGSVTLAVPTPFASVPVPAAFSSSPAGTTASLGICNTFPTGTSGTTSVCTTPTPAITITVTALAASTGTLTATPSPVLTSGQTVLTAQFAKTATQTPAQPGAPSGQVTFVAPGATIPAAKLILDPTATFAAKSTTLTIPAVATPVITPSAGSYLNSTSVSISDATSGATIYYTQDGSTPTTASPHYTSPFTITTSQTVTAIAALSAYLNSPAASAAYTITVSPPTKLAFTVQPVDTASNIAITPALQVAVQDANGNTVNTSSAPVTLSIGTNPGDTSLQGSVTVSAVNGFATFSNVQIGTIANGYTLIASSGTLTSATSSTFNITPIPITMAVQSELVGIGSTLTGTVTLGQPAPTGGTVVTLSSSATGNATISPATLTIAAGQTVGNFTYTGVASGNSTLSASANNYLTGTAMVTGTSAQVSLGTIPPVGPGQTVSLALSLPTAAPPGGTTVTFVSSNTSVATVTGTIFVPAGQRTAATNPQVTGIIIGTTTIVASAPGYAPATLPVTVTVTASFSPTTTYLNLITSTNTVLNISAPAPAGGIKFTLSSDAPTIATVPASVTVLQGATSVAIPITGVANGSTTIRADSPNITETTDAVTVNSQITVNATTTGIGLSQYSYISLPVSPSAPITVTVTSSNPTIATLSTNPNTVGTASVTFTNVTSSNVGYIYLQGQKQGAVTLTVSAPGYTIGTGTGTVDLTGFVFNSYNSGSFSTYTYSGVTSETLYTAVYDPVSGNAVAYTLPLNPGIASVSVPVTSSNTAVGTIVTSPVVFGAQSSSASTNFQPVGPGTTTLTIGTPPAPFTTPGFLQAATVTVTAPPIGNNSITTGVNLENPIYISLPVNPPSGITVTVTDNGPGIVKISNSATTAGGSTVTFPNSTSSGIGYVYVQGISAGTTTLTVSAPGYTSGTITVTVGPSGFAINYYQTSISTQTNSAATAVGIYTVLLNSTAPLNVNYEGLQLSPGVAAVSVPVTSSNTAIGTISTSPVVFHAGDTSQVTNFQPVAAGTTTIAVTPPAGYSTPANYQSIVATVTAPTLALQFGNSSVTTGVNLQTGSYGVYLTTAPTSPLTVTLTVTDATKAVISASSTAVGTRTITFTNVTSTYVGSFYAQGLAAGNTIITATATGYSSATLPVTVEPTGFGYDYYQYPTINTTTFSSATSDTYCAYTLNPSNLNVDFLGGTLSPGVASVSLPVTSSAPSVGTISTSPIVFNPGDSCKSTNFQPISAGTSNITITTPAGYSTPANYQTVAAAVTAPVITVSNVETGLNLQNTIYISLPQTPPNPVTVTVTTNGPAIAVVSASGTVVGGTTLTFTNVTSTNVGYIYVQGQGIGTTTITVSAPGYTNGNGTVTVDPSGFIINYYQGNISTTATSNPTAFSIYPASLTPGTLTVITQGLEVDPGIGTISVPVVSSNNSAGTITTSPVLFAPTANGTYYVNTSFQPVATGTTTLSVQTPAGFSTPSQNTQITATVQ
jgi:hypothetical protein